MKGKEQKQNPQRGDHYFSSSPTSQKKEYKQEFIIEGFSINITSASGVFKKEKLDLGSHLLIKSAQVGKKVLDLGCGNGVVGIALKKKFPECDLWCSDINARAVELTKENAQANKVSITSVESDAFTNLPEQFDTILCNLPQHAGKEICFKLIEESFKHLNTKGTFQVVSRHKKGGKSYEEKMKEVFGNAETLSRESGYRVYISTKEK